MVEIGISYPERKGKLSSYTLLLLFLKVKINLIELIIYKIILIHFSTSSILGFFFLILIMGNRLFILKPINI